MKCTISRYAALSVLTLLLLCGQALAQPSPGQPVMSARDVIEICWERGAINEFLMYQCNGLHLTPSIFDACMNDGPCFGAPPHSNAGTGPMCGAMALPFCPRPSPCGTSHTIACPPPPGFPLPPFPVASACGAAGFPPCVEAQACGGPNSLPCTGPPRPKAGKLPYDHVQPTLQVALPGSGSPQPQSFSSRIQFADTPLPDISKLEACKASSSDEAEFQSCVVEEALPPAYQVTRDCLEQHVDDPAGALICTSGNQDLQEKYEKVRRVQDCAESAQNDSEIVDCLGQDVLGPNERYYAKCVAQNEGDVGASLVCGLSKDLTPEQQIAAGCLVETGGEPHAYAACAGGQLTKRELEKCWEHGIATEDGCYGPHNEFRQFWNNVDNKLRDTVGANSPLYQAFDVYKHNVLAPDSNHVIVQTLNNAINDLHNGPRAGNTGVQLANAVNEGLQSVANSIGGALGIK